MATHDYILVGTLPIKAGVTEPQVMSALSEFLTEICITCVNFDKHAADGNLSFTDNKLFLSLDFQGYPGYRHAIRRGCHNDGVTALARNLADLVDGHGYLELIDQDTADTEAQCVPYFIGANDFEEKLAALEYGIQQMEGFVRPLVGDDRFARINAGIHEAMKQFLAEGGFFVPAEGETQAPATEKVFEFAVEYGFRFEYHKVAGPDEKTARDRLWNEVLTSEQKDGVSSIECTGVRDA